MNCSLMIAAFFHVIFPEGGEAYRKKTSAAGQAGYGILVRDQDALRRRMHCPPGHGRLIFDRIRSIVTDIYGQIVAISTIIAVAVASIALIVRMISRNQRAVDEATSWLKRIVVAWIILNSLGFVVAYLQPLVAGGQYVG